MNRPKPISPRVHGVLDYATSTAVAVAPRAMNFPRPARMLFDSLAAGYTGLSAMTDYPLSVKRVAPFKVHGAAELAIAAVLPFCRSRSASPSIAQHATCVSASRRSPWSWRY